MRLEPLCTISMRYTSGSWHRPYGLDVESAQEGLGFGQGDGEVTGLIEATAQWANYPRRRQDGVWTPNVRGVLTTKSGMSLLLSIHGQSVAESAPGNRRAVTARVELTSDEAEYRWLNTCFLVGEGEIDENREHWWLKTFVCVNEEAQGPPALGAEPPERFRQHGAGPDRDG
jgi:hypothetical protein